MINGENPDPILQRVRALIAAKRYDEAMLDLSLAPESAGVRNLMGLVALKRRKFRQAEEYLRRALERIAGPTIEYHGAVAEAKQREL